MDILYKLFKNRIKDWSIKFAKENKHLFNEIVGFEENNLFKLSREYPSIINNGYRHIEVVCNVLMEFKLDQDFIIVDIGGASGIVAEMMAKKFPKNEVFSFEPIKSSYDILADKIKLNANIRPFHIGLGNVDDTIEINISNRVTSSSLFSINKNISDPYFASSLESNHTEKITLKRLDDILIDPRKVALIKLDVQGFELEALKGSIKTLQRTHFVLTEVMNHNFYDDAPNYDEIDSFMKAQNFELLDIIPSIRTGNKLMEWDVIYYNNNLIKL